MKTSKLRRELIRIFGYTNWPQLNDHIKEATSPFPITVDWQCMALGRRLKGQVCAFGERIGRLPEVDKSYVTDFMTYIRFHGSDIIWRYKNPPDMVSHIKFFDEHGMFDDMEDGDTFILEPPGKARSRDYATARRRAIKEGTWIVEKRGPNPHMRRAPIHHFRPY